LKVVLPGGAGPAGRPGPVIVGVPNAVMAGGPGGGAFTFNLTPEGDDVVTHEVVTALRREALERSQATAQAPGTTAGPAAAPLAHRSHRTDPRRGTRQAQGRGEAAQTGDPRDARHGGAGEAPPGVRLRPRPLQEPRGERGPDDARGAAALGEGAAAQSARPGA